MFYLVFRGLITAFDLKTPGREVAEEAARAEKQLEAGKASGQASGILEGLGGRDNIVSLDNCITRLRVEVRDMEKVNQELLKASGAKAVVQLGTHSVQVVIGLHVEQAAAELKELLKE